MEENLELIQTKNEEYAAINEELRQANEELFESKRIIELERDKNIQTVIDLNKSQSIAKVGIWKWFTRENHIEWSDEMFSIFGVDKKSFKGNLEDIMDKCIHPEDKPRVEEINRIIAETGNKITIDYRIILPDKSIKHIYAESGEMLRDQNNEVYFSTGIVQDITERKQNEKLLRQWADAFENCAHGIAIGLPTANKIMTCNTAFAKLQGRSIEEIASMPILNMYAPEDHDHVMQKIMEADRLGSVCYEAKMIRKDGTIYPVQMDVVSVRDDSGNILYRVATQQDITERSQAEKALRESEKRYTMLFHSNPVPIGITRTSDYRIVDVNYAWTKLTGYTREEAIGFTSAELGLAKPNTLQEIRDILKVRNEIQQHEIMLCTRSGEKRQMLVSSEPISLDGEVFYLNNLLDITERKETEEKLRDNQVLLNQVLDCEPDAIFAVDLNYQLLVNNKRHQQVLVQTGGHPFNIGESILPHDYTQEVLDFWRGLYNRAFDGEEFRLEMEWQYIDGQFHTMENYFSPLRDATSKIIGALVVIHDITERKQAEHKLFISEQKYSLLFHNSATPTLIFKFPEGIILEVNQKVLELTGYSSEEMIGKNTVEIGMVKPEYRSKVIEILSSKETLLDFELPIISKSGENKTVLVNAVHFYINQDHYIITTWFDITARKHAEKQLAKLAERLNLATQSAGIGIWDWDIQKNELIWDEKMIDLYGLQTGEFKGAYEAWLNGLHPDDRERSNNFTQTVLLGEGEYDTEFRVLWPDGSVHWLKADGRVFRNDKGDAVRMIGVNYDITERKIAEENLRIEKEKLDKIAATVPGVICSFHQSKTGQTSMPYASLATKEVYGLDPKDLVDDMSPVFSRIISEDIGHVVATIAQSAESMSAWKDEFRYQHPTKGTIWLEGKSMPVRNADGSLTWHGFIADVTDRKQTEIALRASEEKYRTVTESFDSVIVTVDADGIIHYANRAASNAYDLTPDLMIGMSLHDLFPANMADNHLNNIREVISSKKGMVNESENIIKGVSYWYQDSIQPLVDVTGEIHLALINALDITKRKKAEADLITSENKFRALIERSTDGIVVISQKGDIMYESPSATRLIGFAPEERMSRSAFENIHQDDLQEAYATFALVTSQPGKSVQVEYRAIRKDGSIWWAEVVATNLLHEQFVQGIVINFRDITERKHSEAALAESEKRLRKALETTSDGFWIVDSSRRFIETNEAYTKMSGYTRQELLNMSIPDLEAIETTQDTDEHIQKIIREGGERFDTRHIRKDKSIFDVEVSVNLLDKEKGLMVCFCRDITERKQAEKELIEREAELNNAQEMAQLASWRVDLSDYSLTVSKNYKKLIGIEDENIDITYNYFINRVHPDDRRLMELDLYHLSPESPPITSYFRILMSNGSIKWFQATMVGEFSEGKLIALKGTNIDITDKKNREEEIRSQNEKLSAILNSLPDLLFVHDAKGNYLEAYTTNPDNLVAPIDKLIGKNIVDIFERDVAEQNLKYLKQCLDKKEIVTHEFSIDFKGVHSYFEVRVVPFLKDKVIRYVRNITQSKDYERQIVKLNKAIEQSPVAIAITDVDANITYVSQAFEQITGYPKEEVLGKNTRILKSGKNETELYTDMWNKIKSGEMWEGELINKKKDGTFYWEYLSITPLYENGSQITGYLAVKQDITDKKNREKEILDLNLSLEQKVLERTAELSDLYNNAPCGYHSLDNNGIFEMVNDTELKWLGFAREELLGEKSFRDLLTEESKRVFENNFEAFKKRGYVNDLEFDMVCKNKSILSVLLNATAISDKNGNYLRSRSTIIDHTDRKRAEVSLKEALTNLEFANKELEAFSYSVSHDLRAPIRAIGGFTQILIDDYGNLLDEEGKRICKIIMSSSDKMGRLIDDLLSFSRIGRSEMNLLLLNMEPIIRNVIEELTTPESLKRIQIEIKQLHTVKVDANLIKQVWINLISNAIKYSSKKENAKIVISSVKRENDIVFKIEDNGNGFEMKYVNKLFNVFQRLHTDNEFEGTGVGLAIVKRIINRHDGIVWAESKLNEGATFYFTLPKF